MPSGALWRHEVKEATSLLITSPFCLRLWHHPLCHTTTISLHSMSPCALHTHPHTLVKVFKHSYWRALHVSVGRRWFCCPVCELEWCLEWVSSTNQLWLKLIPRDPFVTASLPGTDGVCGFNRLLSRIICLCESLSDWVTEGVEWQSDGDGQVICFKLCSAGSVSDSQRNLEAWLKWIWRHESAFTNLTTMQKRHNYLFF